MPRAGSTGPQWRGSSCLFLVALLVLSLAESGFAQSSQPPVESSGFGGPDSTPNRIESDSAARGTLFDFEFMKPYYDGKDRLKQDHGFTFGAEYNSVYLRVSDRLPDTDQEAAGGIFRLSGAWEALGRGKSYPGSLMFLVEHTSEFTDTGPSSYLGESVGYAGISNLPYNDEGWRLNTLYWDQKFQGGKYELIGGYLDISDYVDVFPLVSPWTDFFNYAFSIGVGALDLPNDGALGFAGGAWLAPSVYAIAGFVDQNADATDPLEGFDTFFDESEFFKHFEIGWTGASQEAYYLNNVHLTLWHADERDDLGAEDGWGGVVSFNYAIAAEWLVFARAGWAEDSASLLELSISIGGGYTPGGIELLGSADQLGFGFNWGRPNDALFGSSLDDQYAIELYYRLQVTKAFAITPDVQVLINPALNPEHDALFVFGVRARLAF